MIERNFMNYFLDTEDVVGEFISKIKFRRKKIVLFGTGYCLSLFIELMRDNAIEVLALCDNNSNKYGTSYFEFEVKSWESLQKSKEDFDVVISTSHFIEIEKQLKESKFSGEIYYLPIEAYYKNTLYSKGFLEKHKKEFQSVFDLLADDVSRKVFINVIKHNISLDNHYYEEIKDLEIQGYFGTELYSNSDDDIIIDGGAFDGDTYREFLSDSTRKFKEYIAFEPDENNYKKLEKIQDKKLKIIKKGLGEKKDMLRFSSGMGVSSNFSEEGNLVVEVNAIDNLKLNGKVTFIKMDIEGAEKLALLGAKRVIKCDTPTLAISAYHKKEDMYDLVNTIRDINSNYKIYFRHTFYYQKTEIQPDVILYAKKGEEKDELL